MPHLRPILAILLATTIRGLNGIFVKYLGLPVATQTFMRLSTPCILCLGYLLATGQSIIPKDWKSMLTISAMNAARMGLLVAGYIFASPTIVSAVQRVNVIIIIFLAAILLHEKITPLKLVSAIIGLGGAAIIAFGKGLQLEHASIYGILLVFLSAVFSGFINIKYKSALKQDGIFYLIFYQSIIGTIIFGIAALVYDPLPSATQIGVGIIHSFLIGILGFGLFFWGMKRIQASYTNILTYFEIATSAWFSYLFLHEVPSMWTVIGIVCIVCSGILVSYGVQKKQG